MTPFLARYVGAILWSILADYLVVKELVRVTVARKIFSAIGVFLNQRPDCYKINENGLGVEIKL